MNRVVGVLKTALLLIVAAVGTYMVATTIAYFVPGAGHAFLTEKLPISKEWLWGACLRVHVAGGLVCLFASVFLVASWPRRRWPRGHRVIGYVYTFGVLVLLCPAGFYLAAFAKGGAWGTLGFSTSGVIAFIATALAVRHAVRRDFARHQAWIWRSFAQITSAVTFRILHLVFDEIGIPYEVNYLLSLWLSVLGNAAVAEILVLSLSRRTLSIQRKRPYEVIRDVFRTPVGVPVAGVDRRRR